MFRNQTQKQIRFWILIWKKIRFQILFKALKFCNLPNSILFLNIKNPLSTISIQNKRRYVASFSFVEISQADLEKQPSWGVLLNKCSENMQQIYSRGLMPKCDLITLQHGCSPVNLLHIFRTPFPKNFSGRVFLNIEWEIFTSDNKKLKTPISQLKSLRKVCRFIEVFYALVLIVQSRHLSVFNAWNLLI